MNQSTTSYIDSHRTCRMDTNHVIILRVEDEKVLLAMTHVPRVEQGVTERPCLVQDYIEVSAGMFTSTYTQSQQCYN